MKNNISKLSNHLINNFDQELMMLVKEDLLIQKTKIKNKLIYMITLKFDHELYHIIKQDIMLMKEQLCHKQITLAKAG